MFWFCSEIKGRDNKEAVFVERQKTGVTKERVYILKWQKLSKVVTTRCVVASEWPWPTRLLTVIKRDKLPFPL